MWNDIYKFDKKKVLGKGLSEAGNASDF